MPPTSLAKQQLADTRRALLEALPVSVDEATSLLEHVGESITFDAWHALLIRLTVADAADGGATDSPCPLCHAIPQTSSDKQYGFSLPRGLQMHLEGRGRGDPCLVVAVLVGWAREIDAFNTERAGQPAQQRQRRRRGGASTEEQPAGDQVEEALAAYSG